VTDEFQFQGHKGSTVEIAVESGCIFVMDGLLLPPTLRFEGQPYSDGWRLLNRLKSNDIESRARECSWNFIFLAEAIKRTVFGFGLARSLRRATDKVLTEARNNAFNSVEVTEITAWRFLGVHWVSVGAHFRSLQKSNQIKALAARRRDLAMVQRIPGAERL
jgi:hypothetical protein